MTADPSQPLIAVTRCGDVWLTGSAFVLTTLIVDAWATTGDKLGIHVQGCAISGSRSLFGKDDAILEVTLDRILDNLGENPQVWPGGAKLVDLGDEFDDLPRIVLSNTRSFTPSFTFTPHPVQGSASIFAFGSQVSTGVIATIFGILSFIGFIFLLYLRKSAAKKFQLVGVLTYGDEFDGEQPHEDDYDIVDASGEWTVSGGTSGERDESYSYSVSYEYSYSND
jgi:hypothetical protein